MEPQFPASPSPRHPPLRRTAFPDYAMFASTCRSGLSVVRPFDGTYPDKDGWNFGRGWPPSYPAFGRLRALLALTDALALQPKRVLEVAAGDGALSASLAARGCQVVVNDLNTDALRAALSRFTCRDRVQVVGGNLFDLSPAQTGVFDLVIACEVLEHVAHTTHFLRQLRRFLAPGGGLLVTTPNGSYFRNKLPTHSAVRDFTALESQQFKPDADGHLFLITPSELANLAKEAGLDVARFNVWGTPLISGHCRFSLLAGPWSLRVAYYVERCVQALPAPWRQRLCFAMSALLKAG